MSSFAAAESLYRQALTTVSEPGDYFESDEYRNLISEAAVAYRHLEVHLEAFFDVLHGLSDAARLGHPSFGAGLSFPARFLHVQSSRDLPAPLQGTLDALIRQVFVLGLISHFSIHTFPSRSEALRVDVDHLLQEWLPFSLVSDRTMDDYCFAANNLPTRIFDWHFTVHAKPTLSKVFGLGFWRLAKTRSFLRNLYLAGARFGMHFDLATRPGT